MKENWRAGTMISPVPAVMVSCGTMEGAKNIIIRQSNGVHPGAAGYNQMGDTYFCWIKYQLSR